MAQCTSFSPYDDWPATLSNALRLLRTASDQWANHGNDTLNVERVLSVVIFSLMFPYSSETMPLSIENCMERVGSIERYRRSSGGRRVPVITAEPLLELTQLLRMAAQDWSGGSPENPPTAVVLHEIAGILFDHGLVRRPPPRHIEE